VRPGPLARVIASGILGFGVGAVLTLASQGSGATPAGPEARSLAPSPITVPEPPATFLAWTPGGLPRGFADRATALPGIRRVTVVRSDTTWLTRSFSATGELVDDPRAGFAIPLEVAGIDTKSYAPFLPPADRGLLVSVANGQGILGESSARLRGLGTGGVLEFGGVRITVAGILPDELVGANELVVSRRVGARIGVTTDRYALLQPRALPSDRRLTRALERIVPAGLPVRVRAPGETPYFRQGDAVLPPVKIKELFGEFAAKPEPPTHNGGALVLDPAWIGAHIATERVPILGRVRCNIALFPQLRGAMRTLQQRGLARLIHTYHGCFVPRYTRTSSSIISHHTWGIAFDINLAGNQLGDRPHQDPRLVRILERWGFVWGGTFIVPDGNHFEYHRPPPR